MPPSNAQPKTMPFEKYEPFVPLDLPRPHLAGPPAHQGAAVVRRRPARRQPGAHRPDGPEPQAADVQDPGRHGLQGDRGRLPVGEPDRLRLRAPADRRGPDPRRRHDPGPDAVPRGADRAHLRVASPAPHRAIVHFYNSTSIAAAQGRVRPRQGRHHRHRRQRRQAVPQARGGRSPRPSVRYEYSPESYTGTEIDYAVEICDAVAEVIEPTPERQADHEPAGHGRDVHAQHLRRHHRVVPAHGPQPRRRSSCRCTRTTTAGCAVAAAELGVLAGADRVEGCLFGNGERTGNVDLVTLALNLFSQGVDPEIDVSDIDAHPPRRPSTATGCRCTSATPTSATSSTRRSPARTRTPSRRASPRSTPRPRPPVADRATTRRGACPTCPIDPAHVGRTYEAVIRVNSQSGKGGVAYIMETEHGFALPRRLQIEFSQDDPDDHRGLRAPRSPPSPCGTRSQRPTCPTTAPFELRSSEMKTDDERRPPRSPPSCSSTASPSRSPARATARSPRSSTRSRRARRRARRRRLPRALDRARCRRHRGGLRRDGRRRQQRPLGHRHRPQHRHGVAQSGAVGGRPRPQRSLNAFTS